MEFPDFDNGDIQINDETSQQNNFYQGYNNFNNDFFAQPAQIVYTDKSSQLGNYDWSSPQDPEEQKRLDQRANEERERREKLTERIKSELESKQENRKKAIEWIQKWEEQRQNNLNNKRNFNNANEEEFLKNREQSKKGNINPWDKVIDHIQLKESEHKGSRDITRMKNVILQRKVDFVNLKMK